jgi:protein-tyrosine phosphatase
MRLIHILILSPEMTQKILFVCTGNICRSPLAEAVLRHKIALAGRMDEVVVDSAGIEDHHVGERPDPRTLKIADMNGISTEGIHSRQVKLRDFEDFDLILAMDAGHVRALKRLGAPQYHHKIHLFLEFAGIGASDVPDPYFGGFDGFEHIYQMIDGATDELI